MPINIEIKEGYDGMSRRAAKIVAEVINGEENPVLGLATGETPIGFYRELVGMYDDGEVDFSDVTTFNLDEYLGLPQSHPQSYHRYMEKHLFEKVNIREENTHIPDGTAENPAKACKDYERAIEKHGGIDIQLLGIGENGHIGFNEPGSPFDSRTRVVELAEKTIKDNSRFFESKEKVPREAISMGIETIMEADRILLLASEERKADAVKQAVEGPVTQDAPASVLQRHPDCRFILDEKSASKLSLDP